MVALSSDHPGLEGEVGGNLEQSSSVKAACLFYPPADLEQSLRDAVAALNGPDRDLSGTEIENVGDDRDRFIPALIDAGADATFVSYSLGGHGPSLGPDVDRFAYQFLINRL